MVRAEDNLNIAPPSDTSIEMSIGLSERDESSVVAYGLAPSPHEAPHPPPPPPPIQVETDQMADCHFFLPQEDEAPRHRPLRRLSHFRQQSCRSVAPPPPPPQRLAKLHDALPLPSIGAAPDVRVGRPPITEPFSLSCDMLPEYCETQSGLFRSSDLELTNNSASESVQRGYPLEEASHPLHDEIR